MQFVLFAWNTMKRERDGHCKPLLARAALWQFCCIPMCILVCILMWNITRMRHWVSLVLVLSRHSTLPFVAVTFSSRQMQHVLTVRVSVTPIETTARLTSLLKWLWYAFNILWSLENNTYQPGYFKDCCVVDIKRYFSERNKGNTSKH